MEGVACVGVRAELPEETKDFRLGNGQPGQAPAQSAVGGPRVLSGHSGLPHIVFAKPLVPQRAARESEV